MNNRYWFLCSVPDEEPTADRKITIKCKRKSCPTLDRLITVVHRERKGPFRHVRAKPMQCTCNHSLFFFPRPHAYECEPELGEIKSKIMIIMY